MWETVDKLGQWPILQFGVIVLIIIVTVMTYSRVLASKFPQQQATTTTTTTGGSQSTTTSEVSFLYFQGWFKSVLDELSVLRNNQELNKLQVRETFAEEIRKSRHDLKNSLAEVQAEIIQDLEEVKRNIRDLGDEVRSRRR